VHLDQLLERLTRLDADHPFGAPRRDYLEMSLGLNYFLGREARFGHRAKVTVEGSWLPNGSPANVPQTGALFGQDDQFILKAQLQLLF
jgi:hypothetical protein